jgi:hypothetical protein
MSTQCKRHRRYFDGVLDSDCASIHDTARICTVRRVELQTASDPDICYDMHSHEAAVCGNGETALGS